MKAKNKIIDIANYNNGYVTTKQVKDAKINTMELTRLVNNKVLERVSRGFYALTNINSDDFYKYQLKSKNAVYSHNTALYFHNLSDRNPITLDISVPVGYHGSLSNDKNIVLHYIKKDILDMGLIYVDSPFGMKLRVYDKERTICDIIKNKNKVDREIFTKAIQHYSKLKDKDLNKLMKYAKKMNILKKVREYMEILL